MNTPRNVNNVIHLDNWYHKNYQDVYSFDLDDTLIQSVGTYETDYDLAKFNRDNTLLNNLRLKKLPLAVFVNMVFAKKNNLVVIHTSRTVRWWLPFVLWFHGIKYDILIQRPKKNTMPSGQLKREQIKHQILFRKIKIGNLIFFDDSKENRDAIETLNYAIVHDPVEINKSITYDILNSSNRLEVIRMMRQRGYKI